MEASSASGARRNISPRVAKATERGGKSSAALRAADRDLKQFYRPKPISLFPALHSLEAIYVHLDTNESGKSTHIPKPLPASRVEKAQLRYLKAFRARVHSGPLYAVLSDESRTGYKKTAVANPFEDVDHYTKKFKPELQTLAKFDTQKYYIQMFPEELQDVLRPGGSLRRRKRAEARNSTRVETKPEAEYTDETQLDAEDGLHDLDDDALSETNVDDDFEDNDSDMAGDYNAEGYFDGGEDDADVVDGEGGDDGGGYD